MPDQELPCITEMYGLELTFVRERAGKIKKIELCINRLDNVGPIAYINFENFNEEKIPQLYKALEGRGFRLPSLPDFTYSFLEIMKKYDAGTLPVIRPKYSRSVLY